MLELDAHGKKKKKRGMYDSDKAKAALAKAAEERIKKQVLKVRRRTDVACARSRKRFDAENVSSFFCQSADVVRIKEGVHAGKRAMVSKVSRCPLARQQPCGSWWLSSSTAVQLTFLWYTLLSRA